jgi:hypothetical protein
MSVTLSNPDRMSQTLVDRTSGSVITSEYLEYSVLSRARADEREHGFSRSFITSENLESLLLIVRAHGAA